MKLSKKEKKRLRKSEKKGKRIGIYKAKGRRLTLEDFIEQEIFRTTKGGGQTAEYWAKIGNHIRRKASEQTEGGEETDTWNN